MLEIIWAFEYQSFYAKLKVKEHNPKNPHVNWLFHTSTAKMVAGKTNIGIFSTLDTVNTASHTTPAEIFP